VTGPWILMYHAVEPYEEDPNLVCVSPERFRQQMAWLAARGLRGSSMSELRRGLDSGAAHEMVGLTFDDGYAGFPEHVVPVLARYGFSATLFAVADRLGGYNDWDEGPRRALLTPREIADVSRGGVEVGSHGLSHVRLTELASNEMIEEVTRSRAMLEGLVGKAIEGFAYPHGAVDAATLAAVRGAGYRYACAVSPPGQDDGFLLPRAFIGEQDGPFRLRAKLTAHRLHPRRGSILI